MSDPLKSLPISSWTIQMLYLKIKFDLACTSIQNYDSPATVEAFRPTKREQKCVHAALPCCGRNKDIQIEHICGQSTIFTAKNARVFFSDEGDS